ncbi:protein containing Por secretion system C-terminal sorting domain [Lentimicrobium saccharophilum]|uniref:Protein containing Por secretion system C-terminal sorting domain n=1 Tax=Lentimicrobium saccharophilum TaxID=1678841 RepID=A0A0S7C3Z9_9BACT|nr:PKD domain-containing protein [Lentimicrobium saccharophilum]GAP43635.1 protein containing Por secretion system C-terminal sorting domain [Lentimicrobium saccharophilum]
MQAIRFICLFTTLFLLTGTSDAQLSGNYTVGGTEPDFSSIQSAADHLSMYGASGPVTFLIRPGTYSGFTIDGYTGSGSQDTVCFTAENGITSSVVITSTVTLRDCPRIKLHRLTIAHEPPVWGSTLHLHNTSQCLISYCNISNPSASGYTYDDYLIRINASFSGAMKTLTFDSCHIFCPEKTMYSRGSKLKLYINRCNIEGKLNLDDYIRTIYNYNTITLNDDNMDFSLQTFTGNHFYLADTMYYMFLNGTCYQNHFHCKVRATATFHNNIFDMEAEVSRINSSFSGNECRKNVRFTFCDNTFMTNNIFKGPVVMSFTDYLRLYNNHFYYNLDITHGPDQWVVHNNFHPRSTLTLMWVGGHVRNNNLGNLVIYQPDITTASNNNFTGGNPDEIYFKGSNPLFYDPGYIDEEDNLRSTNPALIRKATPLFTLYRYDIDSTERRDIPSIGANEICLDLISDTVRINCADSLCLDLCMEDFEDYYWTPSGLFPSGGSRPVVYPGGDVMVYLNHTDSGIVDSLYIAMTDSLPSARLTFTVNQFEVQFTNRSGCASQFLWEFGDGATSADENPVHTYPHSGAFQGSLTAWNEYGAATRDFTVNIVIQSTGEPLHEKIRLYPNPANDLLYIDTEENLLPLHLEIINSQGMILRTEILTGKETSLSLSGLNAGVYVARMSSAGYQFNRKFMVVK